MKTLGFSPVNKTSLYERDCVTPLEPAEVEQSADAAELGGGTSLIKVLDTWVNGFLVCTVGVDPLVAILFV
jgi:hypothetical protein